MQRLCQMNAFMTSGRSGAGISPQTESFLIEIGPMLNNSCRGVWRRRFIRRIGRKWWSYGAIERDEFGA